MTYWNKEGSGNGQKEKRNQDGASGLPHAEAQRGPPVWKIVERAICDLVDNGDIVEATQHDYIVDIRKSSIRSSLASV